MMNVEEKGKQPTLSTDEGSISGRYIFIVATFVARCDDTIHPIRFYKVSKRETLLTSESLWFYATAQIPRGGQVQRPRQI